MSARDLKNIDPPVTQTEFLRNGKPRNVGIMNSTTTSDSNPIYPSTGMSTIRHPSEETESQQMNDDSNSQDTMTSLPRT